MQLLLVTSEDGERKPFWPLTYEVFMIQEIRLAKKCKARSSKKKVAYFSHSLQNETHMLRPVITKGFLKVSYNKDVFEELE